MSVESTGAPPDADRDRIERRRRDILDAAIKCIRRYGAKKVSVEDIAEVAGISRRTLYRFFPGRRDIIRAVVYDRLTAVSAGVKAALQLCDGFEESVIVGTVETMRLARADRIFEALVAEDRSLTFDDPGDPERRITALSASIWADVFDRARAAGMLRSSMDNREAMNWLIHVHELFDVRRDMSEEEMAEVLRKFVLPSLVPDDRIGREFAESGHRRRAVVP
jgi:TetR/AcrR family transcriptional regulator